MAWIKRNLYFVLGSAAALALMGLAGFYLYSKWDLNNKMLADLDTQYEQMDHLNKEKPHPGSGSVDNIKTAKDQQKELRDYLAQTRKFYQHVAAIPPTAKVSPLEFTASLHKLLDHLQRGAANASVNLPQDYAFSFAVQKPRVTFAPGSLERLAVQLGEVKTLCEVLYDAKVNALLGLRRERVSADDLLGPQTDYLSELSITNEMAVLSPYEVSFQSFSSELAGVLAGFAGSPNGLIVRSVNVEPASGSTSAVPGMPGVGMPTDLTAPQPGMQPGMPGYPAGYQPGGGRFGAQPGTGVMPVSTLTPPGTPPTGPKGGLPTVLDEKLLKITLVVDVVKLLPPK